MSSPILDWVLTGGLLIIVGCYISTYIYIGKVKDAEEKKRLRIYERVDEIKEANKVEFVNKDLCKVLHEQLSRDISEIKTDIKLLLRKNGFKEMS